LQSLRAAFGLGRRATSKIIPIALVIIAALPAIIQLGVAAAASNDIDIVEPQNYYEYVQVVLFLFVAAVGPELVGRDQRNRTLTLYFSRPILRSDYALAKLAAMATALLFLTLVPQTIMFIGNAFAGNDATEYLKDNLDQVFPIVASAVFTSVFMGAIGLAITAQTPRRAYSTGAILAVFVVSAAIASILLNTIEGTTGRYLYLAGLDSMDRGLTFWLFNATPDADSDLGKADLPGIVYLIAVLAVTAVATYILVRRYEKMSE
ncbi:MAG: ABC transporter permease, partial [Hyphomicrobiales bacterium]